MYTQVNWKWKFNLSITNKKNILLLLIFAYLPYSNTCLEQTLTGPRGIIYSKMYPLPFTVEETCHFWYIRGQSNETITVSFSDFNLPGNSSHNSQCQGRNCCKEAFLEIGPVHKGSKPYLFCGQNFKPPAFISFRNQIWIKFTSYSNTGFDRGFNLTYITGLKNSPYCKEDEMQCSVNGKCILQSWHCNGVVECENGEDEICNGTESSSKDVEQVSCQSKISGIVVKLPNSKRCNGVLDCIDGKDEENCDFCQLRSMVSCGPKESDCYDLHDQRCNGILDCQNGRDEKGCNGCASNKIPCPSHQCYSDEERCNGYPTCKDLSDELDCDRNRCSILKGLFLCHNGHCILDSWRCNHVDDCGDGSDESYCVCSGNLTSCGPMSHDCYDRYKQRCDGTVDCLNGQDEKGCGKCPFDKIQCSSVCYYEKERCNGMIQCGDSSDEEGCDASLCNPERGGFLCFNKQCIREKWHCDQANDCRDNSDELNCGLRNSVITAAVMGSLVCGLLLVIAIGCTCKLYALRLSEQFNLTNDGPFFNLDQEFLQREPPPPYAIAMNEQFNCAQAAFLEQIQYAVSNRFGRRHRSRRLRSPSIMNPSQHVSDSSPTDEDNVQLCNNSSHSCPEGSSSSELLNSEPNSPLRSVHVLDNSPFTVHWQCRARNKTLEKVTLDNILPCAMVTDNPVQASGSERSYMHEEYALVHNEHLASVGTNDLDVQLLGASLITESNHDIASEQESSLHYNHNHLNDSSLHL